MTTLLDTAPRVGISAVKGRNDLADLAGHLDEIEALGVDTIELPMFEMDAVLAGKPFEPHVRIIEVACRGRRVGFSVHGPLATNFYDDEARCGRHFEVLKASLEVSARVGARNYVMHTGFRPRGSAEPLAEVNARQRGWLARAGDVAAQYGISICVENVFDWTWGAGSHGGNETMSPSELAAEIAAIGHPHVAATIDFGHAQLEMGLRGGAMVPEVKALAPFARHLHIHGGYGRADDFYMYTDGERFAYGNGDLHLPVGHGDTPWDAILAECTFPQGVVFNIELNPRHWHFAAESVTVTRAMANRARLANS